MKHTNNKGLNVLVSAMSCSKNMLLGNKGSSTKPGRIE